MVLVHFFPKRKWLLCVEQSILNLKKKKELIVNSWHQRNGHVGFNSFCSKWSIFQTHYFHSYKSTLRKETLHVNIFVSQTWHVPLLLSHIFSFIFIFFLQIKRIYIYICIYVCVCHILFTKNMLINWFD